VVHEVAAQDQADHYLSAIVRGFNGMLYNGKLVEVRRGFEQKLARRQLDEMNAVNRQIDLEYKVRF